VADQQDLLGKFGIRPPQQTAPRTIQPTRRTATPPVARLAPVAAPAAGASKFANVKLTSLGQTKKKQEEDRGFWSNLISIPTSAVKAVGSGIMSLPTVAGKAAQEVYGLGELTFDTVLDAIDDDIFTSRLETNYAKGKELGLKGD